MIDKELEVIHFPDDLNIYIRNCSSCDENIKLITEIEFLNGLFSAIITSNSNSMQTPISSEIIIEYLLRTRGLETSGKERSFFNFLCELLNI